MTTLVVYRGWLAADSRMTQGSELCCDTYQKIHKVHLGKVTIAVSGSISAAEEFLQEDWRWKVRPPVPDSDRFKGVSAIVHRAGDRHCFTFNGEGYETMSTNDAMPVCLGSGAGYASAAILSAVAAGVKMTPKQMVEHAVAVASQIDMATGGTINSVRLK